MFTVNAIKTCLQSPFLTSGNILLPVRWRRKPKKPFWKGIAKSKMFKIPPQPVISEEEHQGLKRLYDTYRTRTKAIRTYLTNEVQNSVMGFENCAINQQQIDESYRTNTEWNKKSEQLREQRLLLESQIHEETALNIIEKKETQEKHNLEFTERLVAAEIERSNIYITEENIDKAIEESLANIVNYNYAIDLQGNIYEGYSSTPRQSSASNMNNEDLLQEQSLS